MHKEKYLLTREEITLIEKYRGEQEAVNRKVRYFNFLSSQNDIENDLEFISIRTSLYKFLTSIFSIYYRWCKEHDICYFCSLSMMIEKAYKDSASEEVKKKYNPDSQECSQNLH
jgi:hypothetical protein|tara:strand:+ start:1008 stop:1349 length:342 start_codon:yes stop_codon:yes gene_type:complete